ncbi:MAG TPA: dienelactone hydrolase family protein [Candidatus Eisenbacteria bacterium]|nr:dienelactone hydrolase family protein [Candidatus Eisenbacteria bacterium]
MKITRAWIVAAATLTLASAALAEVKTKEIEYTQGEAPLQGYLAWDDALPGKRPGVIVVHEWWGHNPHARHQAERLAQAGYVAFALDMYGKGKVTTHPADAQAFMAEALKDPAALDARFKAAREQLVADPHVDPSRLAAIGYCFGGGVVLAQARAGADLKAVVTFHGSLATDHPAEKGKVKAQILVLHGAADPMVNAAQVAALEKEMKAAGARYRVILYPGAKHSFTNPAADSAGVPGLEYSAEADRKSWAAMLALFKTALK